MVKDKSFGKKFIFADILAAVLIGIMCLVNFNKGIDITDTGYNLSVFTNVDTLDGMWYMSTYCSTWLGHLFSLLPFGDTMIGMNVYTATLQMAAAISAYLLFARVVKMPKFVAFLSQLIAVGMCWSPNAAVYHYLSYLSITLATVFIYMAATTSKRSFYVIAGIIIGIGVGARFPNITYVALIAAVWGFGIITKRNIKDVAVDTGACVAGFAGAVLAWLISIAATRSIPEYFTGILELFDMSGDASAYSGSSMIFGLIHSYTDRAVPIAILCGCILVSFAVGFAINHIGNKDVSHANAGDTPQTDDDRALHANASDTKRKLSFFGYDFKELAVLAIASGIGVLYLYLLAHKGYLSFDYTGYWSIYVLGVVVTFVTIVACVIGIFAKFSAEDKLLMMLALITIGVVPLGSNNLVYVNFNDMFITMPVLCLFLFRMWPTKNLRPIAQTVLTVIAGLLFQAFLFGTSFVFRDGKEMPMDTLVSGNRVLEGMYTTADNAARLGELTGAWNGKAADDVKLLTFGDVAGLVYYLDAKPAISSTWPSLDSFAYAKFEADLSGLSDYPAVALDKATYENVTSENFDDSALGRKQKLLSQYINDGKYEILYTCDEYTVLMPGNGE